MCWIFLPPQFRDWSTRRCRRWQARRPGSRSPSTTASSASPWYPSPSAWTEVPGTSTAQGCGGTPLMGWWALWKWTRKCAINYWGRGQCYYRPQTKFAKVMFSQASVSHPVQGGGVVSAQRNAGIHSRHPPGQTPHKHYGIRSTSGRYASYWNAFLLILLLTKRSAQRY